jgi:hypothetical protein
MNAPLAVLSLIVLLFGGWGIGFLLFPHEKSLSAVAVRAWLLGAVVVTITLGLLGTIFSGTALLAVVAAATVIPGFVVLRKILKKSNYGITWPWPRGFLEWALCVAILCECVVLMRFAWTTALGWDGLMVWEIKARIASGNGWRLPVDYFSDPTRSWSHPEYPLMLPLLETWVYMWIGKSDQSFARVIFPLFYFAALLLLYSGAATVSGKRWVGLLTASLLFFIPFLVTGEFNVFTGYADFPLAVIYLAAVVSFIQYTCDPIDSRALLFGIYAGALPWMKREGALLWFCVVFVAGVELFRRRKIRLALFTALPGLIMIAAWKIVLVSVNATPGNDFLPVTIANVTNNVGRIGTILRAVAYVLSSTTDWSILWAVPPISLLLMIVSGKGTLSLQLAGIIFMPLLLYSGIYILSNWNSYEAHLDSSLPRLISQLSLVALLTFGIAMPVSR